MVSLHAACMQSCRPARLLQAAHCRAWGRPQASSSTAHRLKRAAAALASEIAPVATGPEASGSAQVLARGLCALGLLPATLPLTVAGGWSLPSASLPTKTKPGCRSRALLLELGRLVSHGDCLAGRQRWRTTSWLQDRQQLHCARCVRTFDNGELASAGASGESAIDLTLTSGAPPTVYRQPLHAGTDIFRNPLVSYVYERGWRQAFRSYGFPGVDEEFGMAMNYLRPAAGRRLLDVSCGSGLFARRFAASGAFSSVVAADYSESMLAEAAQFFQQDAALDRRRYLLLRADVGRLPFATGSLAAVHAGAALHCWPNPATAVAEISRVLAPGGVWVASTFLTAAAPLGELLGDDAVRSLAQLDITQSAYRWWEEGELRDLAAAAGLVDFTATRQFRFIMLAARKPGGL